MKVAASVKKMCRNCKIIRRKGVVLLNEASAGRLREAIPASRSISRSTETFRGKTSIVAASTRRRLAG